ncbi:hypothetical protein C4D60_Mb10t00940 [Musa balbisiana]|uniref:Uncharacterized protein n=1 Tax=Musa balbisiana TaxID=52838 RepID=A0A4S8ITQ5_MUSBA|nr:hypothetical protein C4D60_Mb10t00940 [Musa balbisiana]
MNGGLVTWENANEPLLHQKHYILKQYHTLFAEQHKKSLNLFSKLYVRSTERQMIYVSSQPASSIRNVILSDKFFFE